MSRKITQVPLWIRKLKDRERARAWAIHLFLLYDSGFPFQDSDIEYFEKCVERAEWPENGLFPKVSRMTAARLGIDAPKWDEWKAFSGVKGLLRKVRILPRKKLLNSA